MIRGLVIMNPRRGSKRKTTMKSRRRRRLASRRVRRNPPHSAAMRRKISLAVKRANARRRAGGSRTTRRRSVRRAAVVRRTSRRRRSASPIIIRRTSRPARVIRSRRRRSSGRRLSNLSLRGVLSRGNFALAGGVIGSSILTRVVIARFGGMLPGMTHPIGQAAYALGISVGGAMLVRRFSRNLAEGMVIGGLVTVVNSVIGMITPRAAVGEYLGEYLPGHTQYNATMGLGPATQDMASQIAPTPQVDAYLGSQPAFENSAW